jgi:Leucine-rich repeat (LRR) protein
MDKHIFILFLVILLILSCNSSKQNRVTAEYIDDQIHEYLNEEKHEVKNFRYRIDNSGTHIYIESLGIEYRYFPNYSFSDWNEVQNLDGMSDYVNAEYIFFDIANIHEIDFSPLFLLEKVNYIGIHAQDDSMVDFPNFKNIKNLQWLWIHGASINSFLNIKERLPDIEFLGIDFKNSRETREITNIDHISKMNSIKKLFFGNISNIKFSDFYGLTNLEDFTTETTGTVDLEGCEKLKFLTWLKMEYCTPKNIQYVSKLTSLQNLFLGIGEDVNDFSFLTNLTSLRGLSLYNNTYSRNEIDVRMISNLHDLKSIFFHGFIIDNLLVLNVLPDLTDIGLRYCDVLPDNDTEKLRENWGRNISIVTNFDSDHCK